MKVLGYSERGIIDALFYSIYFASGVTGTSYGLLKNLLHEVVMPLLPSAQWENILNDFNDYEVYIENTLSEFGDPDVVILCKNGQKYSGCLFIEAKVSKGTDVVTGEFDKFCKEIVKVKGIAGKETSSLLYSQLCLKWLMRNKSANGYVNNVDMGTLLALNLTYKKTGRKIGNNNIAVDLWQMSRVKSN